MPKKREIKPESGDMTPMIDMVFQLLIFFMILLNFSDADQNQRVLLPKSELVKPPEGPIENSVTLQIAPQMRNSNAYSVIIGADEIRNLTDLPPYLKREINQVQRTKNKGPGAMTVIIRGHQRVKTGFILQVIRTCQEQKLERFALRVEQDM